jgi:hypothetical protein
MYFYDHEEFFLHHLVVVSKSRYQTQYTTIFVENKTKKSKYGEHHFNQKDEHTMASAKCTANSRRRQNERDDNYIYLLQFLGCFRDPFIDPIPVHYIFHQAKRLGL